MGEIKNSPLSTFIYFYLFCSFIFTFLVCCYFIQFFFFLIWTQNIKSLTLRNVTCYVSESYLFGHLYPLKCPTLTLIMYFQSMLKLVFIINLFFIFSEIELGCVSIFFIKL